MYVVCPNCRSVLQVPAGSAMAAAAEQGADAAEAALSFIRQMAAAAKSVP